MLSHGVQFEFIGFDPDWETRRTLSVIADKMAELAPSDSFIKLIFRKGRSAIEASCRIASLAGEFAAEAISKNPVNAIFQIEEKIDRQLNHWKKNRFVDDRSKYDERNLSSFNLGDSEQFAS